MNALDAPFAGLRGELEFVPRSKLEQVTEAGPSQGESRPCSESTSPIASSRTPWTARTTHDESVLLIETKSKPILTNSYTNMHLKDCFRSLTCGVGLVVRTMENIQASGWTERAKAVRHECDEPPTEIWKNIMWKFAEEHGYGSFDRTRRFTSKVGSQPLIALRLLDTAI